MIETESNALRLAQSHFNRMDMVGTPATATMRAALSKLLMDLDADIGLAKFLRIIPFIGGNAATHALEIFGFDMTFGGTVTHDANGSAGNGTTGFADIPLDCLAEMGNIDGSASAYVRSMTDTGATSANIIGAFKGSPSRRFYMGNLGNSMSWGALINNFATDQVPPTASPGTVEPQFLAGSLGAASLIEGYKNGASLGTSTPGTTNSPGPTCSLFCVVNNDTAGHSSYTDAQLAFVHIGLEMTDAEHLSLYNAVEAYQVTLGRQN